jgi:TolB protein
MFLRSRIGHLGALASLAGIAMLCVSTGPAGAAWPGKNGPILFAGGDAGSGSGLWSTQANGTRLRQLTSNPTDSEVQASPDGRWIVFTRTADTGGESAQHVFIARSNGAGVTQVTTGSMFDRTPSFTSSGRRILFTRFVSAAGEKAHDVEHIFSVRRNGGGLRRLTSGRFSDRNPVMSPNGRTIAFERAGVAGVAPHVFTMRPNGSRVVDATPRLAAWSSQPDFSPSGNRIVFVRGYPGTSNADLFTMRPNGRQQRRLTGRAKNSLGYFSNPSYSPNGRFVVAERSPGDRSPSNLQVIRVRNRSAVATLGGRRAPRTPNMQDPAWLAR